MRLISAGSGVQVPAPAPTSAGPGPRLLRPLIARVARTIRRAGLFGPGDRIAVAVSGGADSVALSFLLRDLAPELGAAVAGLIHVNHGLRGADADEDESFCRALASRLGLAFEVHRADVASL